MYTLSRLLLILAVLICFYSVAMVTAMYWPFSGFVLAVVIVAYLRRSGSGRWTTLGSARWANRNDLRRAKMLEADSGLMLGHLLVADRGRRVAAIMDLLHWRISAKEACREFIAAFRRGRGPMVRMPGAIHTAVFSPSGGGKGVSFVVPFLLTCPDSCVVIDFKGENARLTAEHRRNAFGHKVVLLDVYKEVTQSPDSFNPLDFIDKDDPQAIDDCNDLAKALVIRKGDEKEPHWSDAAEIWISALIAVVALFGDAKEGTRSLQTVREILSNPQKLELAIKVLLESKACAGILARLGGQLTHFIDKEKSSTMTTVSRHLRFLDTLAVAESTKASSFDPAALRSGKMTVYLILPPNRMNAQSALIRMWIVSFLRAVVSGGLQERNKVHFVLDEAASLGHLDAIDDALDKYRGYGIRLQFYFQSLGQLRKCFPDGQDQTLLSNTSQILFAVNDHGLPGGVGTGDYVSARLGEETLAVASGGTSWGHSSQWSSSGNQGSTGGSRSENASSNWQQQARKLLKPEEVVALSPRVAITFTPGVRPICTSLVRYYERKNFGTSPGVFKRAFAAWATLAMASLLCVMSIGLAGWVAERALDAQATERNSASRVHERQIYRGRQRGVPVNSGVVSQEE